ncbi:MAG: thioredoxin domain-containing protein [Patescibacteria group bacterium]|mgnify:CR=1 FL=1
MSENKSWFENGNPRVMFIFGFVSGVALLSLITSGTLVSMVTRGGVDVAAASDNAQAVNVAVANTAKPTTATAPTAAKTAVPAVTSSDHIRGNKDAKVVLIEYADFQCPYCVRHHPNMEQLMEEYGDQIAWVYRHFPLSFHDDAQPAAVASECANEQGKFWEFADAMFVDGADLGTDFYVSTATTLGLNVDSFKSCLSSGKYDDLIDAQQAAGSAAGVSGTPATYVNGTLVSGAVPYATLKSMVDAALAK